MNLATLKFFIYKWSLPKRSEGNCMSVWDVILIGIVDKYRIAINQ